MVRQKFVISCRDYLRSRPRVTKHDTRAFQAYLGHKNIQHTVTYTELALDRFEDFWR